MACDRRSEDPKKWFRKAEAEKDISAGMIYGWLRVWPPHYRKPHRSARVRKLPAAISTYPIISAFTERGQIVIGYMDLWAMAAEAVNLAMLRRRKDETFKQLCARLDWLSLAPTIDDVYVVEVNAPPQN
jgi:hypothetical protein